MSDPSNFRGGAIATRGLLVQALAALLDITHSENAFTEITLEPLQGNDKFDILWKNERGSHATQVKSTENSFTKTEVKSWAKELKEQRTDENCSLVLIFEAPYLGIQGIRISGQQDELPKALLTRAWCACAEISFFANSNQDKTKSIKRAQEDLDEAWEIAERGLMKLYMAEILLSRARLFGMRHDSEQHLYEGTEKDLAEARKLIVICGYGRRQGELEDAEKALAQRA